MRCFQRFVLRNGLLQVPDLDKTVGVRYFASEHSALERKNQEHELAEGNGDKPCSQK